MSVDVVTGAVVELLWSESWRWATIALGAVVGAGLVRLVTGRLVLLMTRHTSTTLDDRAAELLGPPAAWSVLLLGLRWALEESGPPEALTAAADRAVWTFLIVLWAVAVARLGHAVLARVSEHARRGSWIQPKTLPLIEMVFKVGVAGAVLYFGCLAWGVPLTSWLASAGIVGIAVGFAAKDTLANLFSGVFIIADAPYKVGDFIILDNEIRGLVAEIGIRSTRLLTRDDVEVTVPNAVIANSKIVNETGGPWQKMRLRVKVSVAYGSDVDQVRREMLAAAAGVMYLEDEPAPRVRFREFGDSGLLFELLVWIDEPVHRGLVLDELNTRVYQRFGQAGIEIPYSKHDLYLKEVPPGLGLDGDR